MPHVRRRNGPPPPCGGFPSGTGAGFQFRQRPSIELSSRLAPGISKFLYDCAERDWRIPRYARTRHDFNHVTLNEYWVFGSTGQVPVLSKSSVHKPPTQWSDSPRKPRYAENRLFSPGTDSYPTGYVLADTWDVSGTTSQSLQAAPSTHGFNSETRARL